ncbi:MAG: hypothetical protein ABR585_07630 [Gemmatimonadaceae bacterium]
MADESPTSRLGEGFGTCTLTRRWDDGTLTVDQADPRVLVTTEFLNEVRQAASPDVTLAGDVLTIHGVNQKVIYRIGEYLMQPDAYVAEWPD